MKIGVIYKGEYLARDEYLKVKATEQHNLARSPLPRPYLVTDTTEFKSMADGRIYTSKAAYRQSLRAQGLVEVGNDTDAAMKGSPDPLAGLPPVEADIAQAFDQLS